MSSNLYESHKFSEDISREMRIPERIGAKGALDTGAKGFSVNPDYPTISNIVEDMNIPDKILATGEAASATTPAYDPLDPSLQVRVSDLISIDLPPDTITLDKVRYPDIRSEAPDAGNSTVAPRRRRDRSSDGSCGADLPGAAAAAAAAASALTPATSGGSHLSAAILRLQKRLEALEAENEQRRRRELVLYPAIGLYFLFKIVGWILRPRRIAGAPGAF